MLRALTFGLNEQEVAREICIVASLIQSGTNWETPEDFQKGYEDSFLDMDGFYTREHGPNWACL